MHRNGRDLAGLSGGAENLVTTDAPPDHVAFALDNGSAVFECGACIPTLPGDFPYSNLACVHLTSEYKQSG
jgi:hypothetical protein